MDILRPIGELVAIPKPSKPHKAFLSVLVRCRHRVILPHEMFLSFGMRKFIILITDNRLPFSVFRRDLEKYVYQSERTPDAVPHAEIHTAQAANENLWVHKGKEAVRVYSDVSVSSGATTRDQPRQRGAAERLQQEWRPRPLAPMTHPVSDAPEVSKMSSTLVRPASIAPGARPKTTEV